MNNDLSNTLKGLKDDIGEGNLWLGFENTDGTSGDISLCFIDGKLCVSLYPVTEGQTNINQQLQGELK